MIVVLICNIYIIYIIVKSLAIYEVFFFKFFYEVFSIITFKKTLFKGITRGPLGQNFIKVDDYFGKKSCYKGRPLVGLSHEAKFKQDVKHEANTAARM